MADYPIHPIAACLPLDDGPELDDLADSIRMNGQRTPCVLWTDEAGKTWLINGRRRTLACRKAGVAPRYEYQSGDLYDAIERVLDCDIRHRHLDAGQRAMAATELLPWYERAAKERQQAGTLAAAAAKGKAVDRVGEMLGISGDSIERAKRVKRNGAKRLQKAVKDGDISVSQAADFARLPAKEQVRRLNEAQRRAKDRRTTDDRAQKLEQAAKLLDRLRRRLEALGLDTTRTARAVATIAEVLAA